MAEQGADIEADGVGVNSGPLMEFPTAEAALPPEQTEQFALASVDFFHGARSG
jgi:hypothetical protein